MAENKFNEKDSMDINELVSLNEDFSPEFLDQLQQKLQQDAENISQASMVNAALPVEDVTTLFEEPQEQNSELQPEDKSELKQTSVAPEPVKERPKVEENFDDNFIKKYKAKLNKQNKEQEQNSEKKPNIASVAFSETEQNQENVPDEINKVSNGNITEKEITPDLKSYNDSLDFLDGNVKYSKYVIYIDPQNVNFIEGLTVKERKNLINKILREQDDIAITKHRFSIIQTVIKHAIVAVITIAISIPVVYFIVNASLEASINNYRRSQTNFQVLYKEKGKIRTAK